MSTTRTLVKKLLKAIQDGKSQELIDDYLDTLMANAAETSNDLLFYSLPIEFISKFIRSIDFGNQQEQLELAKRILKETYKKHETDAIVLLKDFSIDKLPSMAMDEITELLSIFENNELLQKLCELHEEDKNRFDSIDYKKRIEDLENQVKEKNEEIAELKRQIAELTQPVFEPVKTKPHNYESNMGTAIKQGKLTSVQYLIEQEKYDIKSSSVAPLHLACTYGQLKIVQYLCQIQGIDVDEKDKQGTTPFYKACANGKIDVVEYLCKTQDIDPEAEDNFGRTAFYAACSNGHLNVVKYLCEKEIVNKEATDHMWRTPFYAACYNNEIEVVQYLCQRAKINIDAQNKNGATPFFAACSSGNIDIVKYLVKNQNIDRNAKDINGHTPFSVSFGEVKEFLESLSFHR